MAPAPPLPPVCLTTSSAAAASRAVAAAAVPPPAVSAGAALHDEVPELWPGLLWLPSPPQLPPLQQQKRPSRPEELQAELPAPALDPMVARRWEALAAALSQGEGRSPAEAGLAAALRDTSRHTVALEAS